jgi:hypothetical protein
MAAGLGYKEFATGDVLTAADANGYLASQVVMVFASAAARTSAIASPQEGMISYLKDTDVTQYYSGSAWATIGGSVSPLTTKGDLYGFSTVNARVPVGTNGQVLSADSTAATGVAWTTPASTSFPAFSAFASSNQSISSNTFTKITLGSEEFDTNSNFASNRFTPTVAGYYQISTGMIAVQGSGLGIVYLYKNGSPFKSFTGVFATEAYVTGGILVYLNGSTDYLELYAYCSGTSPVIQGGASGSGTWFTGVGVRA